LIWTHGLPFSRQLSVFIENVLAWFSREQLAVKRSPELWTSRWPAPRSTIDGIVSSNEQLGNTVFETSEPGLFAATAATSGFTSP
jgi:hypothetical protein